MLERECSNFSVLGGKDQVAGHAFTLGRAGAGHVLSLVVQ